MPEKELKSSQNSPPVSQKEKNKSGKRVLDKKKKPSDAMRQTTSGNVKKEVSASSVPQKNKNKNSLKSHTESRKEKRPVQTAPTESHAHNVRDITSLKGQRPIVALTAYDAVMGKFACDAGVDFILVGDSVGTTLLGHKTTIPVDMTDMVRHTAAVRRAEPDCLVVADLPFGEASFSFDRLLASACRLMQEGGADAVKIEGGRDIADDIEKLVATGIPVLGHIGLLPQTVKAIGGYRKFGLNRQEAEDLYTDAIALEEAGCFAVIGEMIDETVAKELSKQILPPLIGIGSGSGCDGQILVSTDVLGYNHGRVPSFVKTYANLNQIISKALSQYVYEVRDGRFPV